MPGDKCIVCGNTRFKDSGISMHRFPKETEKRRRWLQVFKLKNEDVLSHTRVCSRHFIDGNPNNSPQLNIGKRFASPIKQAMLRSKRAKIRENIRSVSLFTKESQQTSSSKSRSVTPHFSVEECENEVRDESLVAEIGEPFRTNYEMFDISDSGESLSSSSLPQSSYRSETEVTVNTARIEALESENYHLKKQMSMSTKERHFRLEQICDNDEDV